MDMKNIRNLNLLLLAIFLMQFNNCTRSVELPELDRYIKFKQDRDHMPGLAIAVISGDQLVW